MSAPNLNDALFDQLPQSGGSEPSESLGRHCFEALRMLSWGLKQTGQSCGTLPGHRVNLDQYRDSGAGEAGTCAELS